MKTATVTEQNRTHGTVFFQSLSPFPPSILCLSCAKEEEGNGMEFGGLTRNSLDEKPYGRHQMIVCDKCGKRHY